MKAFILAVIGGVAIAGIAVAQDHPRGPSPVIAQKATSCSGWKAICETRGPGCEAKQRQCLKSGCWTEGPKHGGATHCNLAKQ